MRVTVYGLWHLGCVTAGCLAEAGHQVAALDLNEKTVADLHRGVPPLHEPGLTELLDAGTRSGRLSFSDDPAEALRGTEVLWVTFDTPVDDDDRADVAYVRRRLEAVASAIPPRTLVLISSQVPVGFTRALERDWHARDLRFACSPENLRLGKALDSFRHPERVVVGTRSEADRPQLAELFAPFCQRIEWMTIESAEMTKHALNAFLATSVTFANELARLCEAVGADAKEVERGLKSEARIGPQAYLSPGAAFAGGTLARDVAFLRGFGGKHGLPTPLLDGVDESNHRHKSWPLDKVNELLGTRNGVVAVLGLTYKPGTSTLRRSSSVELALELARQGRTVRVHDPAVTQVPEELAAAVEFCATPKQALRGADVAVVATAWPEYRSLDPAALVAWMRVPAVVDPGHFLADTLGVAPGLGYYAPGRTRSCMQSNLRRSA